MFKYQTISTLIALALILAACNSPKLPAPVWSEPSAPPPPTKFLQLKFSPVGEDPRCVCQGSRAEFLVNTDKSNPRNGTVNQLINDSLDNSPIDQFNLSPIQLGPDDSKYLGCTLEKATPQDPVCRHKNTFKIIDESIVHYTRDLGPNFDGLGPTIANDVRTCMSMCNNGHARCKRLENAASGLLLPILPLFDAASQKPGSMISKEQALQSYGLDTDVDSCSRGDIHVGEVDIENTGSKEGDLINGCSVSFNKMSGISIPNDMITHLAPTVVYSKTGQQFSNQAGTVSTIDLIAKDGNNAATFQFDDNGTPDSIKLAERLNGLYGGEIRRMTRFGNEVILTTTNGCIQAYVGKQ